MIKRIEEKYKWNNQHKYPLIIQMCFSQVWIVILKFYHEEEKPLGNMTPKKLNVKVKGEIAGEATRQSFWSNNVRFLIFVTRET